MVVRNTFLTVLFVLYLSHSIIAQSTEESTVWTATDGTEETSLPNITTTTSEITTATTTTTTTTTTSPCTDPDEILLFSNGVCISRAAYTGIFLTSIILAGISFLMLMGLLILYCIRKSKSSDSIYSSDNESNISNNKRNGQQPAALNKMAGTTPLEETIPKRPNQFLSNNYLASADQPVPASTSTAPYTATEPVIKRTTTTQQKNVKQQPSESHEMVPRQTREPPTDTSRPKPPPTAPKPKINQGDRRDGSRTTNVSPDDETTTSYF